MASNNNITSTTPVFIGFASNISSKKLFNIELIKQDLLNNINTKKGERLMDPTYGCIVWDLLFEHQNESVVSEMKTDLMNIIAREPRVTLQTMDIIAFDYGYVANIVLFYNTFNTVDSYTVAFNKSISSTPSIS
jgi:phage baseplate assembly protein W